MSSDTTDVATCRVCGCTDEQCCPGGCWWVEDPAGGDLCSRCAIAVYPNTSVRVWQKGGA